MVRCFLIHTICPVTALGPGESRVLYSRAFGPNEAIFCDQHQELSPEERRLLQKEKVAVVARFDASAFISKYSTNIKSTRLFMAKKHDLQAQTEACELAINEKMTRIRNKDVRLCWWRQAGPERRLSVPGGFRSAAGGVGTRGGGAGPAGGRRWSEAPESRGAFPGGGERSVAGGPEPGLHAGVRGP